MSLAITDLLARLHYDESAKTAALSSSTAGFEAVSGALDDAFGAAHIVSLREVARVDTTHLGLKAGHERLALTAKTYLDHHDRDLLLEIDLVTGNIASLLIIVPLPEEGWKLSTHWPRLKQGTKAEITITHGWLVISCGLDHLTASRTVGDRTFSHEDPLVDGLQIYGETVTHHSVETLAPYWTQASTDGVPAVVLPESGKLPDWVEVYGDQSSLEFNLWWQITTTTTDGLGATTEVPWRGLGLCYDLDAPDTPTSAWLWELRIDDEHVMLLRAVVAPGYPVSFTTELESPVPFGEATAAINAILGETVPWPDANNIPAGTDLRWLQYAPGSSVSLSFEAGSARPGEPYLLDVGTLRLREVIYTLSASLGRAPRATSMELQALVEVYGVDFRVSCQPGVLMQGALADPDGVAIGAFLDQALGVDLPFGLDTLTLSDAVIRRRLDGGSNLARVVLSGDVDLIPNALSLREIDLEVEETAGGTGTAGTRSVALGATLALGPVVLRVAATHDTTAGWTLEGGGQAPQGISLTGLVDHLVHAFGVAVPDEVPDVKLTELALSYQTDSRVLTLSAVTSWSFEGVPLVSGDHDVVLGLVVAPDTAAGGRSADFSLRWTLEKSERSFEALAMLSSANSRFELDFKAGEEEAHLSGLLEGLGVTESWPGKGTLDEIFQVSTLSVSYETASRALDFAFTRPVGEGLLLLEYQGSQVSQRLQATWLSDREGGTLGLRALLDQTGHAGVLDEVDVALTSVGLSSLVEDVVGLLTFSELGFQVDSTTQGKGFELLARTTHAALDQCFVSVRGGDTPGLIAGLAFRDGKDLGDLSFLPDAVGRFLGDVSQVLDLQPKSVLFSTLAQGGYVPPSFGAESLKPTFHRTGAFPPTQPFGSSWGRLGKGLAVGGRVVFPEGSPCHDVLGLDELEAVLTVSGSSASVMASLGTMTLAGGPDGQLRLDDAFLRVAFGTAVEIDLGGSLDLLIFDQHVNVKAWLSLSESSMLAHIGIESFPDLQLRALPGVHLLIDKDHPLYFDIGVQFEPEGLDLGLQGSFYIGPEAGDYNGDVTFVLQMIEEIPNPLYVRFDITTLDLYALCEALTGVDSTLHAVDRIATQAGTRAGQDLSASLQEIEGVIDHVHSVLSDLRMDDVAFHWADSVVVLPDGSSAMPGVGFRGRVQLFGWDVYANLEFSSTGIPALTGHFEMDPLDLGGVLKLSGDGRGIRKPPAKGQEVGIEPAPRPGENTRGWYIEPGGPVFHLSTRQAPFLHANLHAELFGFVHADVEANVTKDGFDFDFRTGLGEAVELDLGCSFVGGRNWGLEAHGRLAVHLKGDIGPILPGIAATKLHLDVGMDADVELSVTDDDFCFTVRGGFVFQGLHVKVPELKITARFSDLASLARAIWKHVEDLAHEIFEEVLAPIGAFFEDAAEKVAEVAVAAAAKVAEFAKNTAAKVVEIANETADALKAGLHTIESTALVVAQKAQDILSTAAAKATEAASTIVATVTQVTREAKAVAEKAAVAVTRVANAIAAEVTGIVHAVTDFCARAADRVADTLARAVVAVKHLLDDAAALCRRIAQSAVDAVAAIERALEDVLAEIERIALEIERFFVKVGQEIEAGWHSFEHALSSW